MPSDWPTAESDNPGFPLAESRLGVHDPVGSRLVECWPVWAKRNCNEGRQEQGGGRQKGSLWLSVRVRLALSATPCNLPTLTNLLKYCG